MHANCDEVGVFSELIKADSLAPYDVQLYPTKGRRLSRWLVTYPDGLPARKQSPILVVTEPSVE